MFKDFETIIKFTTIFGWVFQIFILKTRDFRPGGRMSGVGRRPWFTFWLTFLKNLSIIPLGVFFLVNV